MKKFPSTIKKKGVPAKCEASKASEFRGEDEEFTQIEALMFTSKRKLKYNSDVLEWWNW